MSEKWRSPHPTLFEEVKWWCVKHFTDRDVPPKAYSLLRCPETDVVIATEHTDPTMSDGQVHGYRCPECGALHRYMWGAPAPIRLADAEEVRDE